MNYSIPSKTRDLVKELEKAGFHRVSKSGSHIKFKRGEKSITVPDRKGCDLNRMLSLRILKEAGLWQ